LRVRLADARRPEGGRVRILVVDDEPAIRVSLSELLGADGHDVTVAEHAPAALALLEAQPFDLILSDLTMPAMTGPSRTHPGIDPGLDSKSAVIPHLIRDPKSNGRSRPPCRGAGNVAAIDPARVFVDFEPPPRAGKGPGVSARTVRVCR
jgi:hypothetical protein